DPSDKRTKKARITTLGKQLVANVKPGMMQAQTRLVSPLSDEEYQLYMRLTLKLIDANDHSSRAPWKAFQDRAGKENPINSVR
ncbi:MAG: hypothetical protein HOL77_16865, partial [Rhodobacteraceae bacterium]|nr:hypothetical protein [Paracoccaceae bacterium]